MKLTKRKLKQIINEELGPKFDSYQLNELIGKIVKRLFGKKEPQESIGLNIFKVPFEVKVYGTTARLFDSNGKARGTEASISDVINDVSRFLRSLKSIERTLDQPSEEQPHQPQKRQPMIPPRPQFSQK
jgi:hypothetical protein